MTFIASATKSHRLLEPLLPCFSCSVEFLFRLICYDKLVFTLVTRVGPLLLWPWGLRYELATAAGASTTDQKRSGCLPPVVRGASLSLTCGRLLHRDSATSTLALTA